MSDDNEENKIEILPESIKDVKVDDFFSYTFTLSDKSAKIHEVRIIPSEENKGVKVEPPKIYGAYKDPFYIAKDGIQYRLGDEFISTDNWDHVPDGKTVDIFYWRAPSPLIKTYKYLVEIDYTIDDEEGTSTKIETVTKSYYHDTYATWDKWQSILKQKITERQPIWPV